MHNCRNVNAHKKHTDAYACTHACADTFIVMCNMCCKQNDVACHVSCSWIRGEKLSESGAPDVRELCTSLLNAYLVQVSSVLPVYYWLCADTKRHNLLLAGIIYLLLAGIIYYWLCVDTKRHKE